MAEKPIVLIVEDSVTIRETLRRILESEYRLIEAGGWRYRSVYS